MFGADLPPQVDIKTYQEMDEIELLAEINKIETMLADPNLEPMEIIALKEQLMYVQKVRQERRNAGFKKYHKFVVPTVTGYFVMEFMKKDPRLSQFANVGGVVTAYYLYQKMSK
jgi:predicted nucleotidyltransferase